jgi:vacuolar-type H+-ATPase catalytic subunit A/Vma1
MENRKRCRYRKNVGGVRLIDSSSTTGHVVGINGNMVTVQIDEGSVVQNEVAFVLVGEMNLKSEVIKVLGQQCYMQVFEDTTGITVGMKVNFTGEMLAVGVAPGILGEIYDGLQNPLELLDNKDGFFLQRGQYQEPVNHEKTWEFTPLVKEGDKIRAGQWLGEVPEHHLSHKILAPLGMLGVAKVKKISSKGEYTVKDVIAELELEGKIIKVTMLQEWPVKKAIKAYKERIFPEELLTTKQRLIDTMFPVSRGGTACIPGPFGAGKTVLQHLLSKFSNADVVIVLADSTSRWAQAMREMSGRLEEIPGEEAFPAYLESRIAGLYERAGLVKLHNNEKGAVTLIGTVSPAGGNFEEPVTQATLKVVGAFLGLSRKRSDERKYPAIDPLDSYSLYIDQMADSLNEQMDPDWTKMVKKTKELLSTGAEVGKMMTVVPICNKMLLTMSIVRLISADRPKISNCCTKF